MLSSSRSYEGARAEAAPKTLLARVYGWMFAGLLVTAVVALLTVSSPFMLNTVIGNPILFFGLIIAELGLVWYLSARVMTMSTQTASALFLLYSALNGVTLSVVLLAYTGASVASVFVISSLMFASVSAWGMTTKRDMSGWGTYLFMGLIGLIIAMVVNLFLGSGPMDFLISIIGVLLFVGLTAYDTQKIKNMGYEVEGEATIARLAILGALSLYLDFVNLFLFLLRLLGRRD